MSVHEVPATVWAERHEELREELVRATCLELAEHLRDAAAGAKPYIEAYANFMVAPRRLVAPTTNRMHPLIAQLVREIMRDVEVVHRRAS